ncbi:MAG: transposase [Tannerella sp.]|nr:transposase [Tannerella sp.]
MKKERKSHAFNPRYESPHQGTLSGFEHPFDRELAPSNRWVVLAHLIPRDEICGIYYRKAGRASTGREPLNPRIVIGSLIIKHLCHPDDRKAVEQISENIYMQYFPGYSGFVNEKPFDASLFVEIRKRVGMDIVNTINERIVELKTCFESKEVSEEGNVPPKDDNTTSPNAGEENLPKPPSPKGKVIFDATACPQDIACPTDLNLLSDARHKSEEVIDLLYDPLLHGVPKPRTYRQTARREYPGTARKRKKTKKQIRSALRKQPGYPGRNIRTLNCLSDAYETISPGRRNGSTSMLSKCCMNSSF